MVINDDMIRASHRQNDLHGGSLAVYRGTIETNWQFSLPDFSYTGNENSGNAKTYSYGRRYNFDVGNRMTYYETSNGT